MNNSVKKIPLNGTGTEIPALNVTDSYEYYEFTGTVITTGNYAIVPTGTPQAGTTFEFDFNTTIDITTNGNTFQIFGVQLNQTQLLTKLTVICRYDGSAWKVRIFSSLDQTIIGSTNLASNSVTTAKINNEAVTNTKLAQMADQTVKANVSGGSAVPQDIPITTLVGNNAWSLSGNNTTGVEFLGTINSSDLVFKANNTECGRIDISTGNITFGTYLLSNVSGYSNVAIGGSNLVSLTTGFDNTALGTGTLVDLTTGSSNTAVGRQCLTGILGGANNIGIGRSTGNTITTGSNNVIIGYLANVNSATAFNRIALGVGANATSDFQFALPDNVTELKAVGIASIKIDALPSYDDNAAALLGGLTTGELFAASGGGTIERGVVCQVY